MRVNRNNGWQISESWNDRSWSSLPAQESTSDLTVEWKTVGSQMWVFEELEVAHCSLVPRPPLFFVLQFAFSIIHGSGKARKTGKAWSHLSRACNAPQYMCSKFRTNSSLGYSCTRGRNNIHLERPNTDFYRKSFEMRGATMWNQLPNSVKDLSSNTTFKCTIKNTFLGL